eukprot:scaffold1339_cov389-Pavlova_lutheri.AAC.1
MVLRFCDSSVSPRFVFFRADASKFTESGGRQAGPDGRADVGGYRRQDQRIVWFRSIAFLGFRDVSMSRRGKQSCPIGYASPARFRDLSQDRVVSFDPPGWTKLSSMQQGDVRCVRSRKRCRNVHRPPHPKGCVDPSRKSLVGLSWVSRGDDEGMTWGGTPPPLFLHRERGGVAVGSVEPREGLSGRCCPNRSCRSLCFARF